MSADDQESSLRDLARFTTDSLLGHYAIGACVCITITESETRPGFVEVDACAEARRAYTTDGAEKIMKLIVALKASLEKTVADFSAEIGCEVVVRDDLELAATMRGERPKA